MSSASAISLASKAQPQILEFLSQSSLSATQKIQVAVPTLRTLDQPLIDRSQEILCNIFGQKFLQEFFAKIQQVTDVQVVIGLDFSNGIFEPIALFRIVGNFDLQWTQTVRELIFELLIAFEKKVHVMFQTIKFVDSLENSFLPIYKCNLDDLPLPPSSI